MKLSVVRRFFCKKNPLSNKKESMMYDMKAFEKVNDKNFIKKMEKIEKIDRVSRSKSNKTLVPVLLAATSVGIYCLWQQVPYSRMFKHFTLNEYSFQKGYLHTIPLSSLSFQSDGHFIGKVLKSVFPPDALRIFFKLELPEQPKSAFRLHNQLGGRCSCGLSSRKNLLYLSNAEKQSHYSQVQRRSDVMDF
jgi:hypothetical protein